jgi:hypothetical protein
LFYGDYDLNTTPAAPKIKSVEPTGSQILVELLTSQELLGTSMIVNDNTAANAGAPQGYVLKFGPTLAADNWGIKIGSRVLLQGSFVPVTRARNDLKNKRLFSVSFLMPPVIFIGRSVHTSVIFSFGKTF